ncbi:MAG: hypothetical protein KBE09_01800 [Candidatus Pacebacteria bacterium]|nr:hypothetical protein [Candidatus Paceibacterota bacterium]
MEGVVKRFRKHGYGTIETAHGKLFFFRVPNVRQDEVVGRRVEFEVGAPARNGKDAEARSVRLADGSEWPIYEKPVRDPAHNGHDASAAHTHVVTLLPGENAATVRSFDEGKGFGFADLDGGESALVNVMQGPKPVRYPRIGQRIILTVETRPKGLRAKEWRFYE